MRCCLSLVVSSITMPKNVFSNGLLASNVDDLFEFCARLVPHLYKYHALKLRQNFKAELEIFYFFLFGKQQVFKQLYGNMSKFQTTF